MSDIFPKSTIKITDEIFLTQSDPMKVLPPADDQVIGNPYGTVFMNAKTANKLMALQRKYGRWIPTGDEDEWFGEEYKCSVCNAVTLDDGHYCSNCGAKMKEEEE